jgi:hypothetical protein
MQPQTQQNVLNCFSEHKLILLNLYAVFVNIYFDFKKYVWSYWSYFPGINNLQTEFKHSSIFRAPDNNTISVFRMFEIILLLKTNTPTIFQMFKTSIRTNKGKKYHV